MTIKDLLDKIKYLSVQASGNGQGSIITVERELRQAEKELLAKFDAYQRIAEVVHNNSCHMAKEAYARITEIVMEYEKEGGK
jgi:hypothetical protein